ELRMHKVQENSEGRNASRWEQGTGHKGQRVVVLKGCQLCSLFPVPCSLVPQFQSEVHAVCPEIGVAESERWAGRADERAAGLLGRVYGRINQVAGAEHVVPVKEVVADEQPEVRAHLVAEIETEFGHHAELVAAKAADVGWLGEQTAVEAHLLAGVEAGIQFR